MIKKIKNPFKGPEPFLEQEAERFFGRDRDFIIIKDRIFSAKTTLLFASSGVGKTSFINAMIIPNTDDNYLIFSYDRWATQDTLDDFKEHLVYKLKERFENQLNNNFKDIKNSHQEKVSNLEKKLLELSDISKSKNYSSHQLTNYFKVYRPKQCIIILDQFEEALLNHAYTTHFNIFLEELCDVINSNELFIRVMFSMREEFLGELSIFDNRIPDLFNNYYRLKHPNTYQSEEIIRRTCDWADLCLNEKNLKIIINDLCKIDREINVLSKRFIKERSTNLQLDSQRDFVLPMYLQIVCQRLFNEQLKITNDEDISNFEFLRNYESNQAKETFKGFCYEKISNLNQKEKDIVFIAFNFLVTKHGAKIPYELESLADHMGMEKDSQKLENVLDKLEAKDIRIIKKSRRSDKSKWFELYHDMFAPIIFNLKENYLLEKSERARKQRFYFLYLPVAIILICFMTYFILGYNTYKAMFSDQKYDNQESEVIIKRDFNPFNFKISTGILSNQLKDIESKNLIKDGFIISRWDKNHWDRLVDRLNTIDAGIFLYHLGNYNAGIEKLVQAMKNESWIVRMQAADALAEIKRTDAQIINSLITALNDSNLNVRQKTVEALAHIGRTNPGVIRYSLNMLKSESMSDRSRALEILGKLDRIDEPIITSLVDILKDELPTLRYEAALLLTKFGEVNNQIIDTLLAAINDQTFYGRSRAIQSLEDFVSMNERIGEVLLSSLNDEDWEVRSQAVYILGNMAPADSNIISALLIALKDESPDIRKQAAFALGNIGDTKISTITALVNSLKDDYPDVRAAAAFSLAKLGKIDINVISVLMNAKNSENLLVRYHSALILAILNKIDNNVLKIIQDLVRNRFLDCLPQAIEILESYGRLDTSFMKILLNSMNDEIPDIRCQAISAIGRIRINNDLFIEHLLFSLKDGESKVRIKSLEALRNYNKHNKKIISEISDLIYDEDINVRLQALETIGILIKSKTAKELINLLQNKLNVNRVHAVQGLAEKMLISEEVFAQVAHFKDLDKRPWVRLSAWEAFELIEERKENENKAQEFLTKADSLFEGNEFVIANLNYRLASELLEKSIFVDSLKVAYSKFQQAQCFAKLKNKILTLERLESAFEYDPKLKDIFISNMVYKMEQWFFLRENWYLKEILLKKN